MENKRYYKIGNNIRALRNAYGETQEELAEIIHVKKQTISNYEKGIRLPDRDVLTKIANHYLVSVENLENENFSDSLMFNFTYNDAIEIFKNAFPIMKPDDSDEDINFKNAYDLHLNIINKIFEEKENAWDDYEKCASLYVESIENNNSPKSAANILWFLLAFGGIFSINDNSTSIYALKQFQKSKIDHKEFIRSCCLRDEKFITKESKQDLERIEFINYVHETIIECLCILRNHNNYFDLYEYYLAFFYYNNCFDSSLSFQESKLIGNSMLETLFRFKNKYAINFFRTINKYS